MKILPQTLLRYTTLIMFNNCVIAKSKTGFQIVLTYLTSPYVGSKSHDPDHYCKNNHSLLCLTAYSVQWGTCPCCNRRISESQSQTFTCHMTEVLAYHRPFHVMNKKYKLIKNRTFTMFLFISLWLWCIWRASENVLNWHVAIYSNLINLCPPRTVPSLFQYSKRDRTYPLNDFGSLATYRTINNTLYVYDALNLNTFYFNNSFYFPFTVAPPAWYHHWHYSHIVRPGW